MTVDMARALTERLANAPRTKEVMVKIYNAALEGKSKVYLGNKNYPYNSQLRLNITTFFMGLGFEVREEPGVDLGGRRIIKKKKKEINI